MLCIEKPKISYDPKFDVLSYVFGDTSNAYGDEDNDNIIILKDIDTDQIVGYTILNFKRICQNKTTEYSIISDFFNPSEVLQYCE